MGPRDVASATGVSTDTLRHYERLGLLPDVTRTPSGYRRYSTATVNRVILIQRALVVGFSLKELKRVLNERDRGGVPCQSVRALVGDRLRALSQRIEDMRALRDDLTALMAAWDKRLAETPTGSPAHLLDMLASRPVLERSTESHGRRRPIRR